MFERFALVGQRDYLAKRKENSMNNEEQEKINQKCYDIMDKVYDNNVNIIRFSNEKSNKAMLYDDFLIHGSGFALHIAEMMENDKALHVYNHVTLTEWWEVSKAEAEILRKYRDSDSFINVIELNGKCYAKDSGIDEPSICYSVKVSNINGKDYYIITEKYFNDPNNNEDKVYTYPVGL